MDSEVKGILNDRNYQTYKSRQRSCDSFIVESSEPNESLKEHYFWLTNPSDLNNPSEGQLITQYDVTDQQKVDWYKFESLYQYLFVSSANKEQIYILLKNMGLAYEFVQAIMNFHNQDSLRLCKSILEKLGTSFPVNQLCSCR